MCSEYNIYNRDSSKTHCLWLLKCQERNSWFVRGCVKFWILTAESKMHFLLGKWEDLKSQARNNPRSWGTHCFPYIDSTVTLVRLSNHCGRGSGTVVGSKGQRGLGWASLCMTGLLYSWSHCKTPAPDEGSQPSIIEGEKVSRPHLRVRSYWPLIASGGRRVSFL